MPEGAAPPGQRGTQRLPPAVLEALAAGTFRDPFAVLGVHREGQQRVLRVWYPGAQAAQLLDADDACVGHLRQVHPAGIFETEMPARLRHYRLKVQAANDSWAVHEDPYRFPSLLGGLDLHLLGEGSHQQLYRKLGAHPQQLRGVSGTHFSVWAPNAHRVSVTGAFNNWDGRQHVMRLHPGPGIWEIFLPGVGPGDAYKFELLDSNQRLLPLKSDPVGQYHEAPPGNASIVYTSAYQWQDADWQARRRIEPRLDEPVSIYEVHLGSWRRSGDGSPLGYRQLADQLVSYVSEMGFTHVELMPVSEHPFEGSWGYQPIGLYSPTQRFGTPDEFRALVDAFHEAGIAVIIDWVPAHFPRDEHGLVRFDGTALYEHQDARRAEHADWGTLIFNYGRREVINYLTANALYWVRQFHVDALRVDAVASMLYLDYSRAEGEWLPNKDGGNQNLEAVAFVRELNAALHLHGATCYAEESTSWPGVSHPLESGGLGFTYKWNMGWMNDTLAYMQEQPEHRQHHHDRLTFGLMYAWSENFVLPLSHDEVVHCKRSLLERMPGNDQQKFANLRSYFAFMWAHPGKKLLFMGGEFAQRAEWDHDQQLHWPLLEHAPHAGMQALVRELNRLYRRHPALYQRDFSPDGFSWIDHGNREASAFSWLRYAADGSALVCISHFSSHLRERFRLGVPSPGPYRVLLNTDEQRFGGAGAGPVASLEAAPVPAHGHEYSVEFVLPALASIWLQPQAPRQGKQESRH
jgi:1,4-alpha-glucan branching enzyme